MPTNRSARDWREHAVRIYEMAERLPSTEWGMAESLYAQATAAAAIASAVAATRTPVTKASR